MALAFSRSSRVATSYNSRVCGLDVFLDLAALHIFMNFPCFLSLNSSVVEVETAVRCHSLSQLEKPFAPTIL